MVLQGPKERHTVVSGATGCSGYGYHSLSVEVCMTIRVLDQFPFAFYGEHFSIVLASDRKLYVPMEAICKAMGLQTHGQVTPNYQLIPETDFARMQKFLRDWIVGTAGPGAAVPTIFDAPDQKRLL
jgi:hypothetical protein